MTLGTTLEAQKLTHFRLLRAGPTYELQLARLFDASLDWSTYNHAFESDSVPCTSPTLLGDSASRALLTKAGASERVTELEHLMTEGRHEMMTMIVHPRLEMRAALFVHSSTLGRNNGLHALRAGGFRRHDLDEPELEVFVDGFNLGRAMSFKNAAAKIPLGGCKMTVQSEPIELTDLERIGFLSYCIESQRFLTGPDMGFLPEHADVMQEHFMRHVTGGRNGPLGPTGTPTALGCYQAIKAAMHHISGGSKLTGKRAAVQGLGAVGLHLAIRLNEAGMRVLAADTDPAAVQRMKQACKQIEIVSADDILWTECDVLSPCAGGGVLDEETIGKLNCKMVYGSANNPLKATSKQEEIRLAKLLADRNILFQIEWTHNTAGVMSGFEEYIRGEEANKDDVFSRLKAVCGDGTRRLLETAAASGRTPTEIAYEDAEAAIFGPED